VALRAPAAARRTLVRVTLVYALVPGALYYAARYAYFGLPFPLPFYVKAQGHGGLAGLPDVAAFFGDFVRQRVVLVVLFAAGAVEARRVALPALFGSLALALFFTVPSHIMGFESRYLMPLVPVLFAFAGAGAAGILGYGLARFPAQPGAQAGVAAAAYAGLALLAALPFPSGYDQSVAHWRAYGAGLDSAHLALAADLRSHGGLAAQRVIALLDVGAVAYRSDFRVIDTYGLNDARVALSRRSDVAYVFAQQPDLVVVISERPDAAVPVFAWEAPILQMAHARGFTPVASYPFEHDYHLRLYARAGTPLAAAFLRTNRGQSSVLGGS